MGTQAKRETRQDTGGGAHQLEQPGVRSSANDRWSRALRRTSMLGGKATFALYSEVKGRQRQRQRQQLQSGNKLLKSLSF